jgi:hypothetical protein
MISWRVLAVLIAVLLLALGAEVPRTAWRLAFTNQVPPDFDLVNVPVIQRPTTVPAEVVTLPDDAVVIGVEARGRRRAFVLEAFYPPERHVINDLLGGKPITVTYCDVTDCLAVFTDPDADEPLEIATGGWQGKIVRGWFTGSMLLRVGSSWFRQDTGQPLANHAEKPFPYTKYQFERTTWKQWRDARPDTDVYVGEISSERAKPDVEGATCEPAG